MTSYRMKKKKRNTASMNVLIKILTHITKTILIYFIIDICNTTCNPEFTIDKQLKMTNVRLENSFAWDYQSSLIYNKIY